LHGLHLGLFVVVELSANLQDYSSDGNMFEYHVPVLNVAAPSIGPHAGGEDRHQRQGQAREDSSDTGEGVHGSMVLSLNIHNSDFD
jgi:hypothetical protein